MLSMRFAALSLVLTFAVQGQVTIQHGRSLSDVIRNLYGGNGIQLKQTGHQAHFGDTNDFQDFSATLQAVLQSRPVVPVPSAVGLVSYRFNEATGTYEKVEGSLGPILAERGLTTGKGSLNVSMTYTFADFDQINGSENIDLVLRHCMTVVCTGGNPNQPFLRDTIRVRTRVRLKSQALALSAVYGVSNHLDVGLVVPYVRNDLNVFTHAEVVLGPETQPGGHVFDPAVETPDQLGTATAVGIGDIVARAKMRILPRAGVDAAVLADLTLPTGDKANFLGTGRTRLRTTVIASKSMRRFMPHVNLGYEFRFGDSKLSFFDYRIGAEAAATPKLTLSGDIIGVVRPWSSDVFRSNALEGQTLIGRSEIDGVIGGKWRLSGERAFLLNLLVPLNSAGIRPSGVLTAGLQFGL